jgi:cobalt-zinc-cadmium efflux system outer membrane protein
LLIAYNLQKQPAELSSKYDQLLQNIIQLRTKTGGLLEFIDFFDAYKDSKIKQLQQEAISKCNSRVNFTTGTNIINSQ